MNIKIPTENTVSDGINDLLQNCQIQNNKHINFLNDANIYFFTPVLKSHHKILYHLQ